MSWEARIRRRAQINRRLRDAGRLPEYLDPGHRWVEVTALADKERHFVCQDCDSKKTTGFLPPDEPAAQPMTAAEVEEAMP